MNNFCTIFLHLFRNVFNVPSWTASTIGKSNNFCLFILFINSKGPLSSVECPKTLSTTAAAITITNDDSDFNVDSYLLPLF